MPVAVAAVTIAELLTERMKTLRLSIRGMAEYVGVSSTSIARWKNGQGTPDPLYCQKIAKYLKMPLDEVLAAAGHVPSLAEERETYDALPDWAHYLPMLSKHDAEYVGRLVESMARNPVVPDEPPDQGAPQ